MYFKFSVMTHRLSEEVSVFKVPLLSFVATVLYQIVLSFLKIILAMPRPLIDCSFIYINLRGTRLELREYLCADSLEVELEVGLADALLFLCTLRKVNFYIMLNSY